MRSSKSGGHSILSEIRLFLRPLRSARPHGKVFSSRDAWQEEKTFPVRLGGKKKPSRDAWREEKTFPVRLGGKKKPSREAWREEKTFP